MEIRRISHFEDVKLAGHLFDMPPKEQATKRFLTNDGHHLLIAYVDGRPAGMISGIEMTHPDKGTLMFVFELGVDEESQGRGLGTALVSALADLARERDCYEMWAVTDENNEAALATYARSGGVPVRGQVVSIWRLQQN
jgi:ribosomal protein S18 acetylase RimI-like enzyme